MKFNEIDDKIIEEVNEAKEKVKPIFYKTKTFIASFISTIIYTLIDNQEAILEYLKSLDFKYYILALCLFSLVVFYGFKKQNKGDNNEQKWYYRG